MVDFWLVHHFEKLPVSVDLGKQRCPPSAGWFKHLRPQAAHPPPAKLEWPCVVGEKRPPK